MNLNVYKFKDRHDQTVHGVIKLGSGRVKRNPDTRMVCAKKMDDMVRLAPHSDIRKEPPMSCDVCVCAVTALNDLLNDG